MEEIKKALSMKVNIIRKWYRKRSRKVTVTLSRGRIKLHVILTGKSAF
jgi:hypothetical protein